MKSPALRSLRLFGFVGNACNKLAEFLRPARARRRERVSQRTTELASANEELRREIADRQRAEAALQEQAGALAALNTLSRAVSATLSLEQTTTAALQGLLNAVRPDLAFLFLREGERLILKEVLPATARARLGVAHEHRVGECICGLAVRGKKPLFSRDILQDVRCTWEEWKEAGIKSLAALPLVSGDEVIGVLGLASETERDFERQGGFLETLTGPVSVALVNARLFETAQRELAKRQGAEQALRESELRYRTLADSGQALVWTSGPDKKCDYFNQPWLTFTGRTLEQELGDGWSGGVHPDDLSRCLETYARAFDRRERFGMDYRLRRHDGEYRWVQDDASPRYDGQGNFLGYIGHCLDITERKRAELALGIFRTSIETTGDTVFWTDPTGRIHYVNEQAVRELGYTREELLQMTLLDINPDLTAERLTALWSLPPLGPEGLGYQHETRHRRKDGTVFPVEIQANTLVTPDSKLSVAFARNITERKRTEEMLLRVSKAVECSSDAIGMADAQGRHFYQNKAFTDLFEYTTEEVTATGGKPAGYMDQKFAREVFATIMGGGSWSGEVEMQSKSGRRFPVWMRADAIKDEDGKVIGLVGVHTDITERKRAEEALRRSEVNLQLALEAARMGDWNWDIVTGEVVWSARCKALYGLSPETVVTYERFLACVHPEDRERVDATLRRAVEERTDYEVEKRAVWPDGSVHWTATRGRVFCDTAGKPVRVAGVTLDITERKQAEQARREAEETYRTVFQAAPDGVTLIDLEGRITFVSPKALEIYGVGEKGAIGRLAGDYLAPEDRERARGDLANAATGRGVIAREYLLQRDDGSRFAGEISTALIRDVNGRPKAILAITRDITERKQAEEALKESEALLRRSQSVAHLGSYYFDARTGTWIGSAALDELFGIDEGYPKNIEGWVALIHPEDRVGIQDYLRTHVIANRNRFERAYRIMRHDNGKERWVFGLGELEFDAEGRTARMIGTIQDITERKRAELAQSESEARLSSLFRAVAVGIGIIVDRVIQEVNEAACQMVAYSREELIGQPSRMVYATDQDYAAAGRLYPLLSTQSVATAETRWRKKDGTVIDVVINIAPIEPQHPERGVTFVALDITERKRVETEREKLQSQLTQAQKMESVGRLAGGVAHDFNNMLQVISGNVSLALTDLPAESPVRDSLLEVQKSAERSADLTRQLLAFARKQTIAPKVLDLNDTVAGMLKMLQRLIGEDIDLSWRPGANLWPVKLDPSQIDQVLANLCLNARDAIGGVGAVTIETTNVTLDNTYVQSHSECVPGDYVMLAVSDTGKGMDAETQSHLFEPFFTTKEHGKGTGLGLATVFGIVKQNQGLISVYSEPGQGTTFKLYLPRAEAEALAAVAAARKRDLRGTETVLLVEDEAQILVLARRILEQHGYTVLAARAPEVALELATQHAGRIQLLITDVVMPGMNGRELRERLAALQPELRCLYMSGYTADLIAHHGVLNEGVQFLQKPFTIESLAERVRETLNQPLES